METKFISRARTAGVGIAAAVALVLTAYQGSAVTVTQEFNAGYIDTLTLDIGAGHLLDMTNNPLIVQNTPHATIFGYAVTGYNGSGWDGTTGIRSATAALDPLTYSYGIIDNADGFAGLATFFGQTVSPTASLGRYTYSGDVNLDGLVDSSDYFLLDFNFGGPANGRMTGDLDYNGILDSTDYFFIDFTFGSPPLPPAVASGFAGSSSVPEPGSVGLLALGAVGLLGRRRRSSK